MSTSKSTTLVFTRTHTDIGFRFVDSLNVFNFVVEYNTLCKGLIHSTPHRISKSYLHQKFWCLSDSLEYKKVCPTGVILYQSLGRRATSTCMKPPPAMQENPLNKGEVQGGEAPEPGKIRAKRTPATNVPRRKSLKPNPLGTGGCCTFSYLSLKKMLQQTRHVVPFCKVGLP